MRHRFRVPSALALLTLAGATAACSPQKKPADAVGSMAHALIEGLSGTNLTIDPNGYEGLLYRGDPSAPVALNVNAATTLTLPQGQHRIWTYDSVEIGSTDYTLATVSVDGAGVATVVTSHFERIPGQNAIRALVVPFSLDSQGYPGSFTFNFNRTWSGSLSTPLIANRAYGLYDTGSWSPGGTAGAYHFATTHQIVIKDDATSSIGADIARSFSFDPTSRTLRALVQPVSVAFQGYPGTAGIGPSYRHGPDLATFSLLRNRTYAMFDYASSNTTATGTDPGYYFPGTLSIAPDGAMTVSPELALHFAPLPGHRLRAVVAAVNFATTGYFYTLGGYISGDVGHAPSTRSLLVGRRYAVVPGSVPFEVTAESTCTRTSFELQPGTLTLSCAPYSTVHRDMVSQGLTLDPNGYIGEICVNNHGCLNGAARAFNLPEGTHSLYSTYSVSTVDPFVDTIGMGTIIVDAAGVATVDSAAFERMSATTLRAKVSTINVDCAGYACDMGWDGSGARQVGTSVRLIHGRKYFAADYNSQHLVEWPHTIDPSGGVRLDEHGGVSLGPEMQESFTWIGGSRTLQARTLQVTADYSGYPGIFVFGGTVIHQGPAPMTATLMRQRRYVLSDYGSQNTAAPGHGFASEADVRLVDDRLVVGPQTSRHFRSYPEQRHLEAIVGRMTTTSTGYFYIPVALGGSGDGVPSSSPMLMGRRYPLLPNGIWFEFSSDGSCPTPIELSQGGILTFSCGPDGATPSAPANLVATIVSAARIDLRWNNTSSVQAGLRVERSEDAGNTWTLVTGCDLGPQATTCQDLAPVRNRAYRYRVHAYNGALDAYSNQAAVDFRGPATPTGLEAAVASGSVVNLTWADASDNEVSFTVQRSVDGGAFADVAFLAAGAQAYSDTSVPRAALTYRVRAENLVDTATSTTASVTLRAPTAPSALTATIASPTSVALAWTAAAGEATGFRVLRATDGVTFTLLVELGAAARAHTDATVQRGGTYAYQVVAFNLVDVSPASNTASVSMFPPPAPTALRVTVASTTQINLAWTQGTAGPTTGPRTGTRVERAPLGSTAFAAVGSASATATTFNNTGAPTATSFDYRVIAFNSAGDSAPSNVVPTRTAVAVAPTGLTTRVDSTSSITVSWTDSINETDYQLERSTTSATSGFTQVAIVPQDNLSRTVTGLTTSPTYWFRVRARNTAGNSAYVTTTGTRTGTPSAPSNLVLTVLSGSRIGLTWNDNSNNENGFHVQRALASGGPWTQFVVAQGIRTFTDTGLAANTRYFYRVRAYNQTNTTSGFSATVNGLTRALCNGDPNGTVCAGTACNGSTCQAGACVPATPPNCADTDPCTVDTCDPTFPGLCRHSPAMVGMTCADANQCNGTETCGPSGMGATVCLPGTPVTCNDGNLCTTDSCDPGTGMCSVAANLAMNGQSCGGSGCDTNICQSGRCDLPAEPSEECTLERVQLKAGCVVTIGGKPHAVFAYETTGTNSVEIPVGASNAFNGKMDEGQPHWFQPGRHAFSVELDGQARSWRLGNQLVTVQPGGEACETDPGLGTGGVRVGGIVFVLGIDGDQAQTAGLGSTWTIGEDGQRIAAGNASGTFGVSHDGAATYQIPFYLPAARAGFTPKSLALTYNSQSGNGVAGVGWSLAGTSRITRCSRHEMYGDGAIDAFSYEPPGFLGDESICLDGKRLVGVRIGLLVRGYRFEDDPNTTINRNGSDDKGPLGFVVEDGTGKRYIYGGPDGNATLEGRLAEAQTNTTTLGYTVGLGKVRRYAWHLRRIEDRFGQTATYSYSRSEQGTGLGGVEHNLDEIRWGRYRVKLGYQGRTDVIERFARGMRLVQSQRLTSVETFEVARAGRPERSIRRTNINYEAPAPQTERSRVASYSECDGTGACKRPVVFKWQDPDMSYDESIDLGVWDISQLLSEPLSVTALDLNADGNDDLLFSFKDPNDPVQTTPPNPQKGHRRWFYLLGPTFSGTNGQMVPIALPNGDEDQYNVVPETDCGPSEDRCLTDPPQLLQIHNYAPAPVDLDGDGLIELGLWDPNMLGYRFWKIRTDTNPLSVEPFPGTITNKFLLPYAGDVNGDGLTDLLGWHRHKQRSRYFYKGRSGYLLINSGTTMDRFGAAGSVLLGSTEDLTLPLAHMRMMSISGEGRDGLVAPRGLTSREQDHFNQWNLGRPISSGLQRKDLFVSEGRIGEWLADLNGDGYVDSVHAGGTLPEGVGIGAKFKRNTGSDAFESQSDVIDASGNRLSMGEANGRDNGVRVADIDGDGRQELLILGESIAQAAGGMEPRIPSYWRLGYDGKVESRPMGIKRPRPGGGRGHFMTRVMDIDGDRIPEVLQLHQFAPNTTGIVLGIFKREAKQPDLLQTVTDSLGAVTTIAYGPLSDDSPLTEGGEVRVPLHTPATTDCDYPRSCPVTGPWLVKSVTRPTSVPYPNRTANDPEFIPVTDYHHYRGARADRRGRGWLGFESHTVDQTCGLLKPEECKAFTNRGVVITTEFDNRTRILLNSQEERPYYPNLGLATRETIFTHGLPGQDSESTVRTTNYENHSTLTDRVLVRKSNECTIRSMHVPGVSVPRTFSRVCTGYSGYDRFGFARTTVRTTTLADTVTTTTDYEHNQPMPPTRSPRLLGIVTGESVEARLEPNAMTASLPAEDRVRTRNTTIAPDEWGLPGTVTQKFSSGVADLITTYLRREFGDPREVRVTGEVSAIHPVDGRQGAPQSQTRTTLITYSYDGYRKQLRNPAGETEEFVYNEAWQPVAHIDFKGLYTTSKYDGFNRLIETNSPVTGATTIDYRPFPRADANKFDTYRIRRKGNSTLDTDLTHHNFLGQATASLTDSPRGRLIHVFTDYDIHGRASRVSAPTFDGRRDMASYEVRSYDNRGRLVEQVEADGQREATITYWGFDATIENGRRRKQHLMQNDLGSLLSSTTRDPNDVMKGEVTYQYGPFQTLNVAVSRLADGSPITTRATYDEWGNKLSISDPDRGTRQFAYNSFGEPVFEVHPALPGQARRDERRVYDPLGRVTERHNPDGVTVLTHVPAGIRTATSPGQTKLTRSYDFWGRVAREELSVPALATDPVGHTFAIQTIYDEQGRVAGTRYPRATAAGRQFEVAYRYSTAPGATGKLTGVEEVNGTTRTTLWTAEDHGPWGEVKQECFGNMYRGLRVQNEQSGLLESIGGTLVPPSEGTACATEEDAIPPFDLDRGDLIQSQVLIYDEGRNLKHRYEFAESGAGAPRLSVAETYDYDDLNRLASWTLELGDDQPVTYTYPYDGYGNLGGRTGPRNPWTFEYMTPGRPRAVSRAETPEGIRTFHYDERGRRRQDGNRVITYTWFDLPSLITSPSGNVAFEYDGLESRVRKTTANTDAFTFGDLYERRSGRSPQGPPTHIYRVTVGDRMVAEVEWNSAGSETARRYLHADRLGSPELITGATRTSTANRQRFEPYGNSVTPQDPTVATAPVASGTLRGFTGHQHDPELGYVNMKGRIYDPGSGSLLTTDPVVPKPMWAHSYHPYSYVVNNPMNAVDPTGFAPAAANAATSGGGGDAPPATNGTGACVETVDQTTTLEERPPGSDVTEGDSGQRRQGINLPRGRAPAPGCEKQPVFKRVLRFVEGRLLLFRIDSTLENAERVLVKHNEDLRADAARRRLKGNDGIWADGPGKMLDATSINPHTLDNNLKMAELSVNLATLGEGALIAKALLRGATKAGGSAAAEVPRVFWTGGKTAEKAAEAYAKKTGGTTLEMTELYRRVDAATQGMPLEQALPLWKQASAEFAHGAKGTADVFISGAPARLNIWRDVERPILRMNGVTIRTHLVVLP